MITHSIWVPQTYSFCYVITIINLNDTHAIHPDHGRYKDFFWGAIHYSSSHVMGAIFFSHHLQVTMEMNLIDETKSLPYIIPHSQPGKAYNQIIFCLLFRITLLIFCLQLLSFDVRKCFQLHLMHWAGSGSSSRHWFVICVHSIKITCEH